MRFCCQFVRYLAAIWNGINTGGHREERDFEKYIMQNIIASKKSFFVTGYNKNIGGLITLTSQIRTIKFYRNLPDTGHLVICDGFSINSKQLYRLVTLNIWKESMENDI